MVKVSQQSISIYPEDKQAFDEIQEREGLSSLSATIRFVLRRYLGTRIVIDQNGGGKNGKRKPKIRNTALEGS